MAPRLLSFSISQIATQALDRKSAQLGALLGNWEAIVGKSMSSVSFPVKVVQSRGEENGGILHLAVPSAWKTEFQHEIPVLLSRINGFFGHQAIRDIKLSPRQRPPTAEIVRHQPKPLPVEISGPVADIQDPELRRALAELARAMTERGV